jgi:hypothetical protein
MSLLRINLWAQHPSTADPLADFRMAFHRCREPTEFAAIERNTKQERRSEMKDEGLTLTGWQAVPVFLMVAGTQVLTALVMSFPVIWLVNRVFAASAIHAIFASDRLGYWRCVGVYAIWSAASARIKWTIKS